MTNHYGELSPSARQQVDATFWLISKEIVWLRTDQKDELREAISHLVLSCRFFDEDTRAAFEKVLTLAASQPNEGELIDWVGQFTVGRAVLEQRRGGTGND